MRISQFSPVIRKRKNQSKLPILGCCIQGTLLFHICVCWCVYECWLLPISQGLKRSFCKQTPFCCHYECLNSLACTTSSQAQSISILRISQSRSSNNGKKINEIIHNSVGEYHPFLPSFHFLCAYIYIYIYIYI